MEAVNLQMRIAVHNAQLIDLGLFGGPGRDRTDDLFHAMEARSQLRHRPTSGWVQLLYCLRWLRIRQTQYAAVLNFCAAVCAFL